MKTDFFLGIAIVFLSLFFITYITIWSRNTIERIKKKNLHSARSILKDLNDE
ncbi:MAG: hypothetical protein JXB26_10160 [Candidatus Aminicenantes bacterium]|nr:hypothetical protein [Candidatus Aminicenantes bacterium]